MLEQNHSSFKVIDQIYEDEENDLEEDLNNGFEDDHESDSDYEDRSASSNRRRVRRNTAITSSNDSHSYLSMN